MGRFSYYLKELMQKYDNKFEYVGFYQPPEHLEVIRHADVGILTYVPQNRSINALFCAPNKIFEYGMFGLPVLGNDIPGLKYIIEYEKIGCCFEQDNIEDIECAIEDVIVNYQQYSQNIMNYVERINVEAEVKRVLSVSGKI